MGMVQFTILLSEGCTSSWETITKHNKAQHNRPSGWTSGTCHVLCEKTAQKAPVTYGLCARRSRRLRRRESRCWLRQAPCPVALRQNKELDQTPCTTQSSRACSRCTRRWSAPRLTSKKWLIKINTINGSSWCWISILQIINMKYRKNHMKVRIIAPLK